MLSQVLSGLTLVRHAVAITLVMGAAGATVAGAVDVSQHSNDAVTTVSLSTSVTQTTQTNTNDLEAAVNACLATKDPASDACANAVTLSGLSSDVFWAKLAFSFKAQLAAKDEHGDTKTEPARSEKPDTAKTTTGELVGL